MFDHNNIAVLDLTHAGIIIAKKFSSLGFNVTAIDVYGTVADDILTDIRSEYDIQTSKETLPIEEFDLVVSPAHLDPKYPMLADAREKGIEIMTHHRAVGIILSMTCSLAGARVIEITGSKAKTSSASLLAEMLSMKMKVVLHTSRGLELWDKGNTTILNLGLSIAPGSILLALDRLDELGVTADCYIFEVSIGLTGFADIGVITTLEPDYLIAASSSKASDSKMSVLLYGREDELFFLNARDKKALDMAGDNNRTYFTFSDSEEVGADLKVSLDNGSIMLKYKNGNEDGYFSSYLSPNYNCLSYATAFAASGSVALRMGMLPDDILSVISSFKGLRGRMQEKELSGRKLIDNSNSGMDIRSAEKALDYANKVGEYGRIFMVLGEEAAQVCEGLPPEYVAGFINRRGEDLKQIILVGERMRKIVAANISHASGLEEGLDMAMELSSHGDIILSCVKCFR